LPPASPTSARRSKPLNIRPALVIAACAILACAAWPAYLGARAQLPLEPTLRLTPAPITPDYQIRDKNVAFFEANVARNGSSDMIMPRLLAGEYLQRYRERGDIGDVLRAQKAVQRSIAIQPNNVTGLQILAAVELTLHQFGEAKATILRARAFNRVDPSLILAQATFDLELGDYDEAKALLATPDSATRDTGNDVVTSRYDEETGNLAQSRGLLDRAMHLADSITSTPAERRAWFHFRMGELLFDSGDNAGALAAERDALAIFPDDVNALNALARIALANKHYAQAEDAATRGVAIVPNPETLGILADAQLANGKPAQADAARAQIAAVERLGNAQHVNDRLIAVYEADHNVRTSDAYAIAQREISLRADIYAEDTLAWCAARNGMWDVARTAARKALRFDTEDPRMQYHAGVIAQHFGDSAEARKRYARALAINPNFSATFADDARTQLANLK
jgi:tetratricopeptide (TPR) repeat protein